MSITYLLAPGSPALHATVLSQVLKHVMLRRGPTSYFVIARSVMAETGLDEERCSPEIMTSAHLLARSGLVVCNTYDSRQDVFTCGASTTLAPANMLETIWRGPEDAA